MTDFGVCEWFALCDYPAIGLLPHPVLGLVPICLRCCDRVEADPAALVANTTAQRTGVDTLGSTAEGTS